MENLAGFAYLDSMGDSKQVCCFCLDSETDQPPSLHKIHCVNSQKGIFFFQIAGIRLLGGNQYWRVIAI